MSEIKLTQKDGHIIQFPATDKEYHYVGADGVEIITRKFSTDRGTEFYTYWGNRIGDSRFHERNPDTGNAVYFEIQKRPVFKTPDKKKWYLLTSLDLNKLRGSGDPWIYFVRMPATTNTRYEVNTMPSDAGDYFFDLSLMPGRFNTALDSILDSGDEHSVCCTSHMSDMTYAFRAAQLTKAPGLFTGNATKLAGMFERCTKLTTPYPYDTRKAISLVNMYYGCTSLPSRFPYTIDLSSAAIPSGVADMFSGSSVSMVKVKGVPVGSLKNYLGSNVNVRYEGDIVATPEKYKVSDLFPDTYMTMTTLPEIDIYDVQNLDGFCMNCVSLTTIPWTIDLGNVKSYRNMFRGTMVSSVKVKGVKYGSLDGTWVSNVGAVSVEYLDSAGNNLPRPTVLSSSNYKMSQLYPSTYTTMRRVTEAIDTSYLTTMKEMFYGCAGLISVPEMDTSKVTDMSFMFFNCTELTEIPWIIDMSSCAKYDYMLSNTRVSKLKVKGVALGSLYDKIPYKYGNVQIIYYDSNGVGYDAIPDENGGVTIFNTFPVVLTNENHEIAKLVGNKKTTSIPENYIGFENLTDMSYMLADMTGLSTIPKLETSKVTDMSGMFYGCSNLYRIPWVIDFSSCTNYENMFTGTHVSSITVKGVEPGTLDGVFTSEAGVINVEYNGEFIDKDSDVPVVLTDEYYKMSQLYPETYATMTEVPNILDTTQLTHPLGMFEGCECLVEAPEMDVSRMTNLAYMFKGCSSLVELPPYKFRSNVISQMFEGCTSLSEVPCIFEFSGTPSPSVLSGAGFSDTQVTQVKLKGVPLGYYSDTSISSNAGEIEIVYCDEYNIGWKKRVESGIATVDKSNAPATLLDDDNFAVSGDYIVSKKAKGVNNGTSYGYIEFKTPATLDSSCNVVVQCYTSSENTYDYGGIYVGKSIYKPTRTQISNRINNGSDAGSFMYTGTGPGSLSTYTYSYNKLQPDATYYLSFAYAKDNIGNSGSDALFIKTVKYPYEKNIEGIVPLTLTNERHELATMISLEIPEIPEGLIETSALTDVSNMFAGLSALTSIPKINLDNATNMSGLFKNCSNLTSIPEVDTFKVTNMSGMFEGCSKLKEIPWVINFSNCTNFENMFKGTNVSNITVRGVQEGSLDGKLSSNVGTITVIYDTVDWEVIREGYWSSGDYSVDLTGVKTIPPNALSKDALIASRPADKTTVPSVIVPKNVGEIEKIGSFAFYDMRVDSSSAEYVTHQYVTSANEYKYFDALGIEFSSVKEIGESAFERVRTDSSYLYKVTEARTSLATASEDICQKEDNRLALSFPVIRKIGKRAFANTSHAKVFFGGTLKRDTKNTINYTVRQCAADAFEGIYNPKYYYGGTGTIYYTVYIYSIDEKECLVGPGVVQGTLPNFEEPPEEDRNVIALTDDHYKMSDLYPETYDTMTEVPDKLDTSKLTTTYGMFEGCECLETAPEMDLSNVTNTSTMFSGCVALKSFINKTTKKVSNFEAMFMDCESLQACDMDYSSATKVARLFSGCCELGGFENKLLDWRNVTSYTYAFYDTEVPYINVIAPDGVTFSSMLRDRSDPLDVNYYDTNGNKIS